MSVWRIALAVVTAIGALLAIANVAIWHAPALVPVAIYATLLCALALFERGRYRAAAFGPQIRATPTGEAFFDPTTGARMRVYYDAATGRREYREDDGHEA